MFTKSCIMVGLGEDRQSVLQVMDGLRSASLDFLTTGHYLPPPCGRPLRGPRRVRELQARRRGQGLPHGQRHAPLAVELPRGDHFARLRARGRCAAFVHRRDFNGSLAPMLSKKARAFLPSMTLSRIQSSRDVPDHPCRDFSACPSQTSLWLPDEFHSLISGLVRSHRSDLQNVDEISRNTLRGSYKFGNGASSCVSPLSCGSMTAPVAREV